MKKFLLFLMTILCSLNGWAATEYEIGNFKYVIEKHDGETGLHIVGFAAGKNPSEIKIPKSVSFSSITYYVRGVNGSAFKGNTNITSVTFPESEYFKYINESAFEGCTGLTSITIPSGVGKISGSNDNGLHQYAFKGCTSLKTVTINSNTLMNSSSSSIGVGDAFLNATTINMGDNVTSIGAYSFKRSASDLALTTFNFNNVTSIGSQAFKNATKLKNVDLKNVSSIASDAFEDCTFTDVRFSKLKTDAGLPSSVRTYYIDELATKTSGSYSRMDDILFYCESDFTITKTNVTKLVFGENVKYIYMGIFTEISDRANLGITEIECKYNGVGLGRLAFSGLTKLTTFTGKPGFIHISSFKDCTSRL